MQSKFVVANWKMNPRTVTEAVELARAEDADGVVICPPFPFLEAVGKSLKKAALGAQDVFWEEKGAYTGEISSRQLKNIGVEYVIIGHSERRALGETDEIVNKKLKATLSAGLIPILCVGEPYAIHRKGLAAAKAFVKKQLEGALDNVALRQAQDDNESRLIVAYEPIWAISSVSGGVSDDPKEAEEMIRFMRNELKVVSSKLKVLYGGSVNAQNAKSFLERKEIDGLLVGGASLKPQEFRKIIMTDAKLRI